MTMIRKAMVRELAKSAYELDAAIAHGRLVRDADGQWRVGETPLDQLLASLAEQEVYVLALSMEDERPVPPKTCGTCGTEYVGVVCPHCQEVRRRLRGR